MCVEVCERVVVVVVVVVVVFFFGGGGGGGRCKVSFQIVISEHVPKMQNFLGGGGGGGGGGNTPRLPQKPVFKVHRILHTKFTLPPPPQNHFAPPNFQQQKTLTLSL